MIDFSSPGFGKTVIDWRIVHDRASAAEFARAILAIPRTPGNRTSISNALELGAALIRSSETEIVATRNVIDVAGDGPNNDGKSLGPVHQRVMARGIVVNGLAIMDENANGYFPSLDQILSGVRRRRRYGVRDRRAELQGFRGRDAAQADPRDLAGRQNGIKLAKERLEQHCRVAAFRELRPSPLRCFDRSATNIRAPAISRNVAPMKPATREHNHNSPKCPSILKRFVSLSASVLNRSFHYGGRN